MMSYARLYSFTVRYCLTFGLLFGAVSFVMSSLVGGLSWRDVVVGFLIGAALAVFQLPKIIKSEAQEVYTALLHQWVLAVMKQCHEQGVVLDIAPLHDQVLQDTRSSLARTHLFTIDVEQELAGRDFPSSKSP